MKDPRRALPLPSRALWQDVGARHAVRVSPRSAAYRARRAQLALPIIGSVPPTVAAHA